MLTDRERRGRGADRQSRFLCSSARSSLSPIGIWHFGTSRTHRSLTRIHWICFQQMFNRCEVFWDPKHQPGKGQVSVWIMWLRSAVQSGQLNLSHFTFCTLHYKWEDAAGTGETEPWSLNGLTSDFHVYSLDLSLCPQLWLLGLEDAVLIW